MIKYGFELEGFAFDNGMPIPPPNGFPLDGFPGLVELRTVGGMSLEAAYAAIIEAKLKLPITHTIDFSHTEHKFSGADMAWMRKHRKFEKNRLDVGNIYNKQPRRLGNTTLASLQINISNEISSEYKNKDGTTFPARYGLLDVYKIVHNLDRRFYNIIKATNRQPGMYAIKDDIRLEYRSLPNSAWSFAVADGWSLITAIRKAVEGD